MLQVGRKSPLVFAFLLFACAFGAAVALTSCSEEEPEKGEAPPPSGTTVPAPETANVPSPLAPGQAPEPAVETTAVRFRCALLDGVDPGAGVTAWWRADPDEVNMLHRATRHGEHVTVEIPPGPGIVSIHVAGCVVVRREVDAEANRVTEAGELALMRCTTLRGRVVDESGEPIDDAFLWPKAGDISVPLESTDEAGRFSFDGLPDGEVRLRVESDRFVRMTVVVRNGVNADLAKIVMQRGGELRGVVVDENEHPLPNASVWVLDPKDEENRDRMAWPDLAEDGTFSVRLAPGRYRVGARAGGRGGGLVVDVRDGKTSEATVVLSP